MEDCNYLLSAVIGGGSLDVGTLIKTMSEWDIEAEDVVEDVKSYTENIDITSLYLSTYQLHVRNIKDEIKELCKDLKIEDDNISFDEDNLDNYEVKIYVNYMCTTYDDPYELWDYNDIEDIKEHMSDDLVDFLVEEEIIEIGDVCEKICEEKFDPDDVDEEDDYENCVDDCNEYYATKKYLKKLIEEGE